MLECKVVNLRNDLGAQQVGVELLNYINHRNQLIFSYSVIQLSVIKCLASIVDNIRLFVLALPQHRLYRMATSIAHHPGWRAPIRRLDDGGRYASLFYPTKYLKTLISTHKWGIVGHEMS